MTATSCPFCGVGTDLPHETQEACIAALHAEIARMRLVVERLNVPCADDPQGDAPGSAPRNRNRDASSPGPG